MSSTYDKRKNVSASKPTTPVSASRTGVDSRIPKTVAWPSVTENRALAAKHRPPKTIKLPSGGAVQVGKK